MFPASIGTSYMIPCDTYNTCDICDIFSMCDTVTYVIKIYVINGYCKYNYCLEPIKLTDIKA